MRYGYQHGWPGSPGIEVRTPLVSCGCNDFPAQPCSPFPPSCGPFGCPILLDSACVIYHKNMNVQSGLINLNLPNGSTLELILNTIDQRFGPDVPAWSLPTLRGIFTTITTLQQFGQDVDTEFGTLIGQITTISGSIALTKTDTATLQVVLTGTNNRNISGNVKVSATSGNLLSILSDGLMVTPQTLSIDYTAKTITLSGGAPQELSSLVCGVSGFLGNVTSDPTAIDGQYWFRTDLSAASGLKIKLNGAVRTITTS
jgi:hypothetical protein